jgi:tetratricopeptide (TPR) repeat protein
MHLARGRLLAGGQFSLSALEGRPTWLYDLFVYGVVSLSGGMGLVLAKALLVVGLAACLLALSRGGPLGRAGLQVGSQAEAPEPPPGTGWFLASFATVLALLAMSVFFQLQSAAVSYLFLPLALWCLKSGDRPHRGPAWLPPWPLLVLFVIWANTDGGLVIGLGTVALVWLGTVLDAAWQPRGQEGRLSLSGPVLSFMSCLAVLAGVCLLNPAPWSTFALPQEIAGSTATALSPFQSAYFARIGTAPAAGAYFLLLGLSLLSFVLNVRRWSWQRFLPWLALVLASALHVRMVPFFAGLAAPLLAWNVREIVAGASGAFGQIQPIWRGAVAVGRGLTALLVVFLPVCAWPGWLQGPPFEPRRWAIEPPPSLEKGVMAVRDRLREGKLGAQPRGLHLSRETLAAFAWFCPEEHGMRDDGLAKAIRGESLVPLDWAGRMRAAGINHLVLYDTDRGRLFTTLVRLREDPQQWPLLYLEGQLAIFGWRDPAAPAVEGDRPFAGAELDLRHLALHPAADKKAPASPTPKVPEPRQWWEAFWRSEPRRALETEEALQYLFHAEALQQSGLRRHFVVWMYGHLGGLVGSISAAVGGPGLAGAPALAVALADLIDARLHLAYAQVIPPGPSLRLNTLPPLAQLAQGMFQKFAWQQDDTDPALLLLAIRAARRAVNVNADDASAYLVLGECYHRLLRHTRERALGEQFPDLLQLRRAQASAALNQAIALRPDLAQAHLTLANLYAEMNYLDLLLEHLQTVVRLRDAGAPVGPGAPTPEELQQLAEQVQQRRNAYTITATGDKVLQRAAQAYQAHLAGTARDLLLESDIAAFGTNGMMLEVELLLRTGRARDVREWIKPEHRATLGGQYYWLRAQALAAGGDYAAARGECEQFAKGLFTTRARGALAGLVVEGLLDDQPTRHFADRLRAALSRAGVRQRLDRFVQALQQDANLAVLRGLLWLEEGEVEEAEIAFREALTLWKGPAAAASGAGLDFPGRGVAQAYLDLLTRP